MPVCDSFTKHVSSYHNEPREGMCGPACVDLHVWTCLQHHGACDLHAALGLAFQGVVLGLRGEGGSMDEDPRTPIRASFFLFNG